MKKFLCFILLYGLCNFLSAQSPQIDSLNKVLARNIPDTLRMKTLISLAGEHSLYSPELAIKDCEASLSLARKINSEEGIGEALGWLAYLHEQQGNIDKALDFYQQSLVIAKSTGSKKSEANIYSNIAAIYKDQGRIEEALKYNEQSMAIRRVIGDSAGISTSYNNMALIYQNQGRIPEALDYYSRALKIYERLNDKDGIATALQNLGFVYKEQKQYDEAAILFRKSLNLRIEMNDKYGIGYSLNGIGGLFEEQGKLDSAIHYYEQALQVRNEIGDKQGISYSLKNIGNTYLKMGRKEEAKEAYKKSLAGFEEVGDKWGTAIVTNLYGASILDDKNYNEGEMYLEKSLRIARDLGYPADIRNAADNLQQLYRRKNEWKEALMMNDLYIQMRDSVQNDKNRKASLKTQFRYEYEKREAALKSEQDKKDILTNEQLKRQKLFIILWGSGFAVMFLMVGFYTWYSKKLTKEKKRSDELLLNILPSEVAEELKQKGKADAKQFDDVTVMFTDFKNFTQISEKLSPTELVAEIHTCFEAFDNIIGQYNIEKIKTIGDSYMCAGGLPVANTTNATDVVNAAIEIQQFMQHYSQQRKNNGKEVFEIRIGIHTGPVVAGIVGVKKFAYDIWGDTVNIASRMESSGEAGKVNISGSTYELVKEKFRCKHRGKISAKNKGEIDMYFVEAAS
jgi:adenylate cyclase